MRLLQFGCLVLTLLGCRAAPPVAPSVSPSPQATMQDEVVATVLGQPIMRRDLDSNTLGSLVIDPLFEKYRSDNGITATESEIAEFMEALGADPIPEKLAGLTADDEEGGAEMKELWEASQREIAESFVIDWKTSKRMYEEFGGTVIFQQANPLEPVGAYRTFLEAQERAGIFQIYDAILAESFWSYFRRDHPFVVDPDKVDYSTPWWKRK